MHPLEATYQSAMRVHQLGDLDQAETIYRRILEADPHFARGWHLLGVLAHQRGDTAAGIQLVGQALELDSSYSVFFLNFARMLHGLGRVAEAEACLRHGLQIHPDDAHLLGLLGMILCAQEQAAGGLSFLEEGLRREWRQVDVWLAKGWAHAELGQVDASLAAYAAARALGSRSAAIRWATQLPLVYRDRADIEHWRTRFREETQRLVDTQPPLEIGTEMAQPVFGLAYHGQNEIDHQRLLTRLYRVPNVAKPAPEPPTGVRGKIHVAFASAFFSSHTIGKLMRGIITHLNRDDFFVTVLSVGKRHQGDVADRIRAAADLYLDLPNDWQRSRAEIARLAPDILFYPELGMDHLTYSLAFERLAPVQCVWWGHPLTTGLPTIDHFVSSDWIEPLGADAHYCERLTRLPAITYYYRPEPPPSRLTRADLGLTEGDHLYLCPQSIYKFHHDFDPVLADILRRDPMGKIVLIRWIHDSCDQLLRDRFAQSMLDVADRVHFIRRFTQHEYLDLLRLADVLLDPLHFGGGNTSYEAFALGLPIVTLPSAFFRGRITLGLYRQMDLADLVARDEKHYVDLALSLAQDGDNRKEVCRRIEMRGPRIFEDLAAVRAFEEFFRNETLRLRG